MRKEYLVSLLFLVAIVISGVSADPFAINYYVNTDSSQEYLNLQYGNYYDNVSLRLWLQATDGYSNVPVYVSQRFMVLILMATLLTSILSYSNILCLFNTL